MKEGDKKRESITGQLCEVETSKPGFLKSHWNAMSLKCLFIFFLSLLSTLIASLELQISGSYRISPLPHNPSQHLVGGTCINSSHPQQSHDFIVFSQQYDWTCHVPPWKAVLYTPLCLIPHLSTTMQEPRAIYSFLSMSPNWGSSEGPIHQQGICRGLGRHWSYFSTSTPPHHPPQKQEKRLH